VLAWPDWNSRSKRRIDRFEIDQVKLEPPWRARIEESGARGVQARNERVDLRGNSDSACYHKRVCPILNGILAEDFGKIPDDNRGDNHLRRREQRVGRNRRGIMIRKLAALARAQLELALVSSRLERKLYNFRGLSFSFHRGL
jgi:hypothetical protein